MPPSREKLSDLLHGSALPPPPTRRALIFGAIAALLGALACGRAAYNYELRIAYLITGIGILVGYAIVRARGYGKQLSLAAAVLTLLAIPAAYYLKFALVTFSWCTEQSHATIKKDAAVWQQLQQPSDEQVFAFAKEQGWAFTTREAFDHYPGKLFEWFATQQPSLAEWRSWEYDNSRFADYLMSTTTALDYVMASFAIMLAFGIVQLRTMTLENRAKQKAIARRQEEARAK